MNIKWFIGIPKDKKDDAEKFIRNSTFMADRLQTIINQMKAELESQEISESSFEDPNWAYKQAYIAGQRKVLSSFTDLLSFKEKL